MAERASAGDITVDADGRVHAAALEAIPAPASMLALRDRCQDMMPPVDFGELVQEVMSWRPGFVHGVGRSVQKLALAMILQGARHGVAVASAENRADMADRAGQVSIRRR